MKKAMIILFTVLTMLCVFCNVIAEETDFVPATTGKCIPKAYFETIAQLTIQHGEYEYWSLETKQALISAMLQWEIIDDQSEMVDIMETDSSIDAFLLQRYGVDSLPNDISVLGLMRIAWVELGDYTAWTNETWVWYSHMMIDVGLWNENNDVDVYEMPTNEVITSEEAICLAEEYLLSQQTLTLSELAKAKVYWHYSTHISDIDRESLVYTIRFQAEEMDTQYVSVTPDGQIKK